MVGIISHVSELKQEIEDQLIVSKDESGSHDQMADQLKREQVQAARCAAFWRDFQVLHF